MSAILTLMLPLGLRRARKGTDAVVVIGAPCHPRPSKPSGPPKITLFFPASEAGAYTTTVPRVDDRRSVRARAGAGLVDRRSCHAYWLVFRNRLKAPRKLASDPLGWHHDRVRALLGKVSEAMSIDENKAVAKKPFGEILNDRRVELVDEIVAASVVDHNRIIFARPGGPGAWPRASACSSPPSPTFPPP